MRVIGTIICLLFFHYSSLSQDKCIQVKSEDNKPVQYVTAAFRKDKSVYISDENGYLCRRFLSKVSVGDTLLLTAIGFENRQVVFSGNDTILMHRRFIILPEVVMVQGEGKEETWGTRGKTSLLFGFPCSWGFRQILNSMARMIYPEGTYKKAEIKSVSFFDETDKGINVPVRLRVFLLGKDSLPISDYLEENIIVNTKGRGWLTIDLSGRKLIMPKDGLAFCIELFADTEDNFYYDTRKRQDGKKYTERIYGFSLGMEKEGGDLTLSKYNEWNPWWIHRSNPSNCNNLVCRVKVRVWR